MLACINGFHIPSILVELLLQVGHLFHNTHTQMHTSTYLFSVLHNCLGPDKNGLLKLKFN